MKNLKRIISLLLTVALAVTMLISLGSCSTRLSGTYSVTINESKTFTYEFDGKTVKLTESLATTSDSSTSSLLETLGGYSGSEYSIFNSLFNSEYTGEYDISRKRKSGYEITFVWDATGKYEGKSEAERTETYAFDKLKTKTGTYIKIGEYYYQKQ